MFHHRHKAALFPALLLILALAACSAGPAGSSSPGEAQPPQPAPPAVTDSPTAEPTPELAEEPEPEIPDAGFQDPLAYFGATEDNLGEDQYFTDPPHSQRSFSVDLQERDFLEDYVAYLTSGTFNLELLDKEEQDYTKYSALYCISYCLAYTGDQEIGIYAKREDEPPAQVEIGALFYYDQERTLISWNWADGMEPVDTGYRYDRSAAILSGGKPSSGGDGERCISCGGSGRCSTCGGSGKVYKTLPGTTQRVEVECTSCYRSGQCRDCGGSGRK